jgi:hypothetical protein
MSINLNLILFKMFIIPKHLKLFACGSLRAILPTNLAKATAYQAQKKHSKPLREAKA